MTNLVESDIAVRYLATNDKRPASGQAAARQLGLDGVQETGAVGGLVFRVVLLLIGREEGLDEEGAPYSLVRDYSSECPKSESCLDSSFPRTYSQ